MGRKKLLFISIVALAGAGVTAFALLSRQPHGEAQAATDPRALPHLVRAMLVSEVPGVQRSFTGTVEARVQSNIGFRVPGKLIERLVNVGETVTAGQPLIRIDDTDLRLALIARQNAVSAARAILVQATAEEKRFAVLVNQDAIVSVQRYEQAKAALDTAVAQLAAAEAEADVAENAANYAVLTAEVDGTVVATLAEPGQVVAAGQAVVVIAQSGAREAVVNLPEDLRPTPGSRAMASVYGASQERSTATLRQIADAADPSSRTYEARYVLEGESASAPLGSTVTVWIVDTAKQAEAAVPVGAILDDGRQTGVWVIDSGTSAVRFAPVQVKMIGGETASVTGIAPGAQIVALGAHLLTDGAAIRIEGATEAAN